MRTRATGAASEASPFVQDGLTVARIQFLWETGEVSVSWLPELFKVSLSPDLRRHIAERLRFQAAILENGELEDIMRIVSSFADEAA